MKNRGGRAAGSMSVRRSARLAGPRRHPRRCHLCPRSEMCSYSSSGRVGREVNDQVQQIPLQQQEPEVIHASEPNPVDQNLNPLQHQAPEAIHATEGDMVEQNPCFVALPSACNSAGGQNFPVDHEGKFRRDLMRHVRAPFIKEEFERLKKSHVIEGPQLRIKACLDSHPELVAELHAVLDDKQKAFNLLRGYLYWFIGQSREGAFKPWLDEKFMAFIRGEGPAGNYVFELWERDIDG